MAAVTTQLMPMQSELFDEDLNIAEPGKEGNQTEVINRDMSFPSIGGGYMPETLLSPTSTSFREKLSGAGRSLLNFAAANPSLIINLMRSPQSVLTSALYGLVDPEHGLLYSKQGRGFLKNAAKSVVGRLKSIGEDSRRERWIEGKTGYSIRKLQDETAVYNEKTGSQVFKFASTPNGITIVTDNKDEADKALNAMFDAAWELEAEKKISLASFLHLTAKASSNLKENKFLNSAQYQEKQLEWRNYVKSEFVRALSNPNMSVEAVRGGIKTSEILIGKQYTSEIINSLKHNPEGLSAEEIKKSKKATDGSRWVKYAAVGACLAAAAVVVGNYVLNTYIPQHTDSDKDGWTDWEEMNKYHTNPKVANPNAKHFVEKGGSAELVEKIAVLDADGKTDPNETGFVDYLFNENLTKLSSQQVAAIRAQCIQEVLKDSVVSDKEGIGLRTLSLYPGEVQARYANFSENVFEYFSTLASLLAKDPSKKDFADYAVLNKLRMKGDGVISGYILTDLSKNFLANPEKYARDVLNSDLKKLESVRPDVVAELRKLPDYENVGIKQVEANEDVVYTALLQNPIVKANLDKILNEGIPDKRKYDAALQALLWYFVDHNSDEPNTPMESTRFDLKNFIQDVWRYSSTSNNYQSDKWKNPDEVFDRLNSPLTARIYAWDNIKYAWIAPNVPEAKLYAQTPLETFNRKLGVCADQSNFLAYVLSRNGYDAKILRVDWDSNSHDVCAYRDKNNLFYFLDNTFTISGRENMVVQGPFDSIRRVCERFPVIYSGGRGDWKKCYLIPPHQNGFNNATVRDTYLYLINT